MRNSSVRLLRDASWSTLRTRRATQPKGSGLSSAAGRPLCKWVNTSAQYAFQTSWPCTPATMQRSRFYGTGSDMLCSFLRGTRSSLASLSHWCLVFSHARMRRSNRNTIFLRLSYQPARCPWKPKFAFVLKKIALKALSNPMYCVWVLIVAIPTQKEIQCADTDAFWPDGTDKTRARRIRWAARCRYVRRLFFSTVITVLLTILMFGKRFSTLQLRPARTEERRSSTRIATLKAVSSCKCNTDPLLIGTPHIYPGTWGAIRSTTTG